MAKKEKELLEELEVILKELKDGKQQSASTVAANRPMSFSSFFKIGIKTWKTKILLIVFIFLLIGAVVGFGAIKLFNDSNSYTEKGSVIEQVRELSSLATSQAFVKAVIEKEDNQFFGKEINTNIPGTQRKILFIVPGTVTAGVSLKDVQNKDVSIDEENKAIEMTLPRAEILQEPSLDFEQVQTYSVEGIFREDVNWEEAYELASEAKVLVEEEAIAQGLLVMAEKNAEKTIEEFFTQLGYEVTVRYGN